MEEIYLKKHYDFVKTTNNILIKKYFGKYNFFHDSFIKEWKYEPDKSILKYKTISDNYFSIDKKQIKFDIIFTNIFEIKFKKQFGIDKEFYKDIDWNNYFHDKRNFCFLYCLFEKSEYSDILGNYIKNPIYKARLFFDNYFNIELDFCKLEIEEPKFLKGLSDLEFYELIKGSDYNC